MNRPDFALESAAQAQGFARIAGVDEVGRGPLAGPVTAAAVVLDASAIPPGLNDSKKMSARQRLAAFDAIVSTADVSIGHASVAEIDEINILRASHLAMARAVAGLRHAPDYLLIDGNLLPRQLDLPAQPVVRGDARCLSIAAASIIAKIVRDAIMRDLAQHFAGYGWETNMGYPTEQHRQALRDLGITPHHRRSFAPVHNILYQEKTLSR